MRPIIQTLRNGGKEDITSDTAEEIRSAAKPQRPPDRHVASFYGSAAGQWKTLRSLYAGKSDSDILLIVARSSSDPRAVLERLYTDFQTACRDSPALNEHEKTMAAWFGAVFGQMRRRTVSEQRAAVVALPQALGRAWPEVDE